MRAWKIIIAAVTMVSGGEAGGKKRKASATEDITARREPRRGLGVAELERIRVALEMAERCYAAASSLSSAPQHHSPPSPTTLVVHAAGVAAAPAHHQHAIQYKNLPAGNGAVHQLQMTTRGYLAPYCLAQHYYGYDSLTRLFTTNGGHPSSHQNLHSSHHQNLCRQADHIQSAVTALPVMGQATSSESSSSASQQRQGHRRAHAKTGQTTTTAALPQVAFVDLVDSDDDTDGGDVEELDLELKL